MASSDDRAVGEGRFAYRADIDGLRAIAVLSVVVYHFQKDLLPGGYVGVDIFFVISGFLITGLLWREMDAGSFSFGDFYLRRIKRIAPAFLVMCAVTLLVGLLLLLPGDLLMLARSALWGMLSLANVYFWNYLDTGYFAEAADEVPLLHTWSLGVEEQFYFIWPVLLLIAARMRTGRKAALFITGVLCFSSFAIGQIAIADSPKFAYYMLPARAGELMLGAGLALWSGRAIGENDRSGVWWEIAAIFGFCFIAWSLYFLNDASSFPGINAIWPCVGAALVMMAGQRGSRVVSVLLTSKPMVSIGLISYSLYLWHWPVLAYIRYFVGEVDGLWVIGALAVILLLSYLSYRWVELPARHWRAGRLRQVAVLYLVPTLVLGLAAGAVVATGGLRRVIESSAEYKVRYALVEKWTAPANESVPYNCIVASSFAQTLESERCLTGDLDANNGVADVLLWGDSLAAAYLGTISVFAKEERLLVRNASHSACPPLFGTIEYGMERYRESCSRFREEVELHISKSKYRLIVISGGWAQYDKDNRFRSDLAQTIAAMEATGARVLILGQMPWMGNYRKECDNRAIRLGLKTCSARMVSEDGGLPDIEKYLAELAGSNEGVSYLTPRSEVCSSGTCSPYLNGKPIYFDRSHLSMKGSWELGRKLWASGARDSWIRALTADGHQRSSTHDGSDTLR